MYNSRQKFVNTIANFVVTICLLNGLLMLLTITGNVLVLTAMLPTPSLRSLSTIFLCSLAASDLLVGFVVQPIYIGFRLNPGPELEHLAYILVSLACSVSLCTMTAISVDRFMALHFHLRYPDMMTNKRAVNISLSIWFLACTTSCIRLWNVTYAKLVMALGIAICLIISTLLYIKIYKIARKHQLQIQIQQQPAMQTVIVDHKQNLARWTRSALNTSIYDICMTLCYFPMFTSLLLLSINPKLERQERELTMNMVFVNSSINPILYCWRLRELRHAVLKIIKQLLCKKTEEN